MRQRWPAQREVPSHTDDWLMTYADMITLLLCFFAIFLSLSVPKKDAQQTVAITETVTPGQPITIAQTIRLPAPPTDVLNGNLPFHRLQPGDRPGDEPGAETKAKSDEAAAEARPAPAHEDVSSIQQTPVQQTPVPPAPAVIAAPPSPAPPALAPQGDRITRLDMSSAAFFDSGSATLSKSGEAILRTVAADIKSDKFKDYLVTVEGHTDDSAISTARFPSNWELSTARASAVVHFFLDQAIPAQRLRAAGYADTFPKAPNRDAKGNAIPENQAQNRRVVIKLEKLEKAVAPQ